jgi:hypothetical protein
MVMIQGCGLLGGNLSALLGQKLFYKLCDTGIDQF